MFFASVTKKFKQALSAARSRGAGADIPRIYAKQLIGQYNNAHHNHLRFSSPYGYNTVYVSMQMKGLIDCLKAMYDGGKGSDICRIYFGAHDGDAQVEGHDVSNKMTLIFVGGKTIDGCVVEQVDDTDMDAYDFGTLCPPQCNSCCTSDTSLATEVFGNDPCLLSV